MELESWPMSDLWRRTSMVEQSILSPSWPWYRKDHWPCMAQKLFRVSRVARPCLTFGLISFRVPFCTLYSHDLYCGRVGQFPPSLKCSHVAFSCFNTGVIRTVDIALLFRSICLTWENSCKCLRVLPICDVFFYDSFSTAGMIC